MPAGDHTEILRLFRDPRILSLVAVGVLLTLVVWQLGGVLVPFFLAAIIVYILGGVQRRLERLGMPRGLAKWLVFLGFFAAYLGMLFGPLQFMSGEVVKLIQAYPEISNRIAQVLERRIDWFHGAFGEKQTEQIVSWLRDQLSSLGTSLFANLSEALAQTTTWATTLLLTPLLVFFLILDRETLIAGIRAMLPRQRELLREIWIEMEALMGGYLRGKLWEILIIGAVTSITFALMGFEYAFLVGIITGISVIIPYLGAAAVTIPIAVLGITQWGAGSEVVWLLVAYAIIQFLDGNVLVTFILRDSVKLPPFVILMSVVVFGSLFGFWGVFFAIPLATLLKTIWITFFTFRDRLREEHALAPGSNLRRRATDRRASPAEHPKA